MESENETVESVIANERKEIDYGEGVLLNLTGKRANEIFDRIEAAHKREVAELRKCLKEAIDYNCAMCKSKGKACEVEGFCAEHRWRKVLEGAAK